MKEEWVCLNCGEVNPDFKPWRKKLEYLRYCTKCNTKRPARIV